MGELEEPMYLILSLVRFHMAVSGDAPELKPGRGLGKQV